MDIERKIIEITLPFAMGVIIATAGFQTRGKKGEINYFPFAGILFALAAFMVYVDFIR